MRRSNNLLWATGTLREGSNLYFRDSWPSATAYTIVNDVKENVQVMKTWHKQLGHLSERGIKMLQRILTRIRIGTPSSCALNADCVDCLKSGQHRELSHYASNAAKKRLKLVHSDICGPMKEVGIGLTYKYFAIFVDNYSKMCWVYPIEKKDHVVRSFQHFCIFNEKQSGCTVGILRSDNGGEYIGGKMTTFCESKGIVQQTSQAYSPEMNGSAERAIKTVVFDASAMLWGAQLGITFWVEAVATAVYLKNRRPHAGKEVTPFELWTRIRPNLSHLKIFGCRCYALVPGETQSKWESHSEEALFMGYYEAFNLFCLYNLTSKKFVKKRDVVFHESLVSHHGFAADRLPVGLDIKGDPIIVDSDENLSDNLESALTLATTYPLPKKPVKQTRLSFLPSASYGLTPSNYNTAMACKNSALWFAAMKSEIDSLVANETLEYVELPRIRNGIPCKWVYLTKLDNAGNILRRKARLVACEDVQKTGVDFHETFAPVAKFSSLKILLSIAAVEDLEIDQGELDHAFINGVLDKEVYMSQPSGFADGTSRVLRLKKSLYGL